MATKLVGVNEIGRRVGQYHHRAVLTDRDVQLIWGLRAEGWTYSAIADKMEISKETVADIIKGRRRVQEPTAWREVCIKG